MEIQQLDLLLRIIIAHLLADFVFQTNAMVKGKNEYGLRSKKFYIHVAIVGVTTYLLMAVWAYWWAALAIMVLHGGIDYVKIRIQRDNAWTYVGDQGLHFLSIFIVWQLITEESLLGLMKQYSASLFNTKGLVICIAYILMSLPSGVLIGYLTKKWQDELETSETDTLKSAGKWIGVIERTLILTFILINQWAPVGFLLTAKSVFRFGDLKESKDHKKTEYILIGTLLSFTLAIFTGLFVYLI